MSHAVLMAGWVGRSVTVVLAVVALSTTSSSAQLLAHATVLEEDRGLYVVEVLPGSGQLALQDTTVHVPRSDAEVHAAAAKRKEPVAAFVLSLLLPGAGQAYNGQWGKGGLMFGGTIASLAVFAVGAVSELDEGPESHSGVLVAGLAGAIGFSLWSMIDAPITASKINKTRGASLEVGPRMDLGLAPSPARSASSDPATVMRPRIGLSLARVRF